MHDNPPPIFVCYPYPFQCIVAWGGTQVENFSSKWITFKKNWVQAKAFCAKKKGK